jgi:hypothetical protein
MNPMRNVYFTVLLSLIALSQLSACIVEEGGHHHHWWW